MIELTAAQIEALNGGGTPLHAVNPATHETYVLVPLAEYRQLAPADHDDTGWTREEIMAQAWIVGQSIGWDDMDEYDDLPSPS